MGLFITLSCIIGKSGSEVEESLTRYAEMNGGGLQLGYIDKADPNLCTINYNGSNTTICYPYGFIEEDRSSEFISRELNAPVFVIHVHDGDLWMYLFYNNGILVDQFNPIPDYWDENLSEEEIDSWKGNADKLASQIPGLKAEKITNYLTRWDLEKNGEKAYEDDLFKSEDWQFLDFMNKLDLPWSMDDNGEPIGNTYRLWTFDKPQPKQPEKERNYEPKVIDVNEPAPALDVPYEGEFKKKWWKFWG